MGIQSLYVRRENLPLWERMATLGQAQHRSLSWMVTQAIREYLDRHENDDATP